MSALVTGPCLGVDWDGYSNVQRAVRSQFIEFAIVNIERFARRTLRLFGEGETFPTVGSVAEALHNIADRIGERRRLLPLLTKTA